MFIYLNKRRGQTTLEYGVVIAIVVAGLIAMQSYIKRGMQGRLKQASDEIGEQYSADTSTSTYSVSTTMNTSETVTGGAQPMTTSNTTQTQNRTANENVGALSTETWK